MRRWVPKMKGNEKTVSNYHKTVVEAAKAEIVKRPSRRASAIWHFRHKAFSDVNDYPIERVITK